MSVIRGLFRHPVEWLAATLAIGLAYGTGALVALASGRSLHLVLHSSVIAALLVSAMSAVVGIYVQWLDRRADRRALQTDRRAEERARWMVRYLRENWPTQQQPILRVVGSDGPASVSLPAQANRDRRQATVSPINPDRALGFMEGVLAPREPSGEFPFDGDGVT